MPRVRVYAQLASGSKYWIRGGVRGGKPARGPDQPATPGESYDYQTEEEARAHIERNGGKVLEVQEIDHD